jgi:mannose/cellobiose epimerase-like protein (N-acyl-D-glucosamine 2-epimerase family)
MSIPRASYTDVFRLLAAAQAIVSTQEKAAVATAGAA